jgi:hypothetical protein
MKQIKAQPIGQTNNSMDREKIKEKEKVCGTNYDHVDHDIRDQWDGFLGI